MRVYSTHQALTVFADLEAAYRGEHGYGSQEAEIYAYRLLPHMPSEALSEYGGDERGRQASDGLADVLDVFLDTHPRVRVSVDGEPYKRGSRLPQERHRWHVRVERS